MQESSSLPAHIHRIYATAVEMAQRFADISSNLLGRSISGLKKLCPGCHIMFVTFVRGNKLMKVLAVKYQVLQTAMWESPDIIADVQSDPQYGLV